MVYGEDCPTCGGRYVSQCRCMRGHRTCANGHHWFCCQSCKKAVAKQSDHGDPDGGLCARCRFGSAQIVPESMIREMRAWKE